MRGKWKPYCMENENLIFSFTWKYTPDAPDRGVNVYKYKTAVV